MASSQSGQRLLPEWEPGYRTLWSAAAESHPVARCLPVNRFVFSLILWLQMVQWDHSVISFITHVSPTTELTEWTASERPIVSFAYLWGNLLTAVDSLDASVISRFPFSPTRAGTRINTSESSSNTSQCWKPRRKAQMSLTVWHWYKLNS